MHCQPILPRVIVKVIFKRLLLLLAIGLPLWALSRSLPQVASIAAQTNVYTILGVYLGLVIYTLCNASVWSDVLGSMGHRPGRVRATRLWIECEAMKWLPGGIWGYASRVVKAPDIGVSRKTASASLAIELLLTIAAWAAIGLVGLSLDPAIRDQVLTLFSPLLGHLHLTSLAITAGLVLIMSPWALSFVRKQLITRFSSLRGTALRPSLLGRSFASYLGLCVLHAALLVVLVGAVSQTGISLFSALAADGGAWLIGFFAIGIPGGIGVREAGITWFLAAHITTPEAMTVAVLWRALQIGAELTTLLVSKFASHRCTRAIPAIDISV